MALAVAFAQSVSSLMHIVILSSMMPMTEYTMTLA